MTSPIASLVEVPYEGNPEAPIVFIGEAPGETEVTGLRISAPGITPVLFGPPRPFIGDAGQKLRATLQRNGLSEDDYYLTNLCKFRPVGNDFENIIGTEYYTKGLEELRAYFENRKTKPVVVVPLGNFPLNHLVPNLPKPKITNWRGSIIRSNWKGLEDVKIIPTYHPSAIHREAGLYPIFDNDISRIFHDSQFVEFKYPELEVVVVKDNPMLLEEVTQKLLAAKEHAVDIENYKKIRRIACVGFATETNLAYCLVYNDSSHFRKCLSQILESNIPKTFQFGTHDVNYLAIFGYRVNNYAFDTYIAAHVMFPELPSSLAFLCSIYTREPFYKYHGEEGDEKSWSDGEIGKDEFWIYNGRDCARTLEIKRQQELLINKVPAWKKAFDFEMRYLKVNHSFMQSGMPLDIPRMMEMEELASKRRIKNAGMINTFSDGFVTEKNTNKQKSVLTRNQLIELLHTRLGLAPRKTKEGGITVDADALIALLNHCISEAARYKTPETKKEWQIKQAILTLILEVHEDEKLLSSYLRVKYSNDNRVRSTYKFGPETGRLASEKFVDGTGFNAQTLPRGDI